MSNRVARRIEQVQAPVIPIVGKMISDHPGTISLGQGIVHYPPPPSVFTRIQQPPENIHRYGDVCGDEILLELIRQKLWEENRIECGHDAHPIVTAGSNMGFLNAILAIADIGDEIILMSPYYFNHEMAITIAGCRPVIVPTTKEYQLDLDAIRSAVTERTRAIVTVSPNNPCGVIYPPSDLLAVGELCAARGIYHISDEAYEYFVYGSNTHYSAASRPASAAHTISLFTLSKAFGMASWRVGYMVVPEALVMPIKKIQDTNLVCPPRISQLAATAAMERGYAWCQPYVRGLEKVRDQVLEHFHPLADLCHVPETQGAFYALLQLHSERPDMELVEALIRDFGVAVLPGSTFGVHNRCAIRVSFGALESDTVLEGIGRLTKGLKHLLKR